MQGADFRRGAGDPVSAFNSLFEMPRKERVRRAAEEAPFNSLFEMRPSVAQVAAAGAAQTFNSLFEMQKTCNGWVITDVLPFQFSI